MPAQLLHGKPVAESIVERIGADGTHTGLRIVQVGEHAESDSYFKQLLRTAKQVRGLTVERHLLPADAELGDLHALMEGLNADADVHGYMVHLPLPPALQERLRQVRRWIADSKDVDFLGYHHAGKLLTGKHPEQLTPPTPYAVMKMLKHYGVTVAGKIVAIVGDGLVGSRLKVMVGNDLGTQIVCNAKTPNIASLVAQADIVVGAAGTPDLITGDMIKEGATVINVGMHFDEAQQRMHGDVDVASVSRKAARVTPILGGLGPVTVASLIQNVFRAKRSAER